MGTGPRLEEARDEAPQGAADDAGDQRDDQVQHDRQAEGETGDTGGEAAEDGLALCADVEQATAERERDRKRLKLYQAGKPYRDE